MAQFSVNTERFDPYKNFKFRVKWDGRYVAGVSKVGALKRRPRLWNTAMALTRAQFASRPASPNTKR